MKFASQLLVGAAAALVSFTSAAQHGPYLGLHAGINDLGNWSHRVEFGAGVGRDGTLSLDRNFHWGVIVGRQFDPWRAELEYEQGRVDINGVQLGPVGSPEDANGSYRALLVNGYRNFELTTATSAYIGVGIGWGRTQLPALPPLAGCNCYASASGNGAVWQVRAGVEREIAYAGHVFLQYTFLRVPSAASGTTPSVHYKRKDIGAVTIGLRRLF